MADVTNISASTSITPKVTQPSEHVPPKTHAGLYTGMTLGAIGTALRFATDSFQKSVTGKSGLGINTVISLVASIGIGAIVDAIRNKRTAEFAQKTVGMTPSQAANQDEDAELTPKGNPYVKTATGKKYSTLINAILAPTWACIRTKTFSPLIIGAGAVGGAISGLITGAIMDYFSNKSIRKQADQHSFSKIA